ncbi:MAG: ribonuclease P protein component [Caldimonas sp.]
MRSEPPQSPEPRLWFGAVVPKRHARRAVTRTLMKRQIRTAVLAHADALGAGLWVVRLRAAFDRTSYLSASSTPLRRAVRDELDRLLRRCGGAATAR